MESKDLAAGLLTDIFTVLLDIRLLISFQKDVLTSREAAAYLGISQNTLNHYKSKGKISYYKPNGRLDYFRKEDLDAFAIRNKIESSKNLKEKVSEHILKH